MISYHEWKNQQLEVGFGKDVPGKKNDQGGFDPTPAQVPKFKKLDLITLPVEGTNCGNCMFFRESEVKGTGFCIHEEVREWITDRMCCIMWNNSGVKRKWGTQQT